ncbi:MAG: IS1634 family transposase [Actinomycetota bacterium]|nr:IS1634 family transposase [Actinomycetota bacterium]
MYFKFSLRYNKLKKQSDAYYRLVESYRHAEGRVCHRTILNIGFIDDDYSPEQLNQTARILTDRYEQKQSLFEPTDTAVIELTETLWQRIIREKRLDLTLHSPASRRIDADTIRHSNVREIGSEWICHQTLEELGISKVLSAAGFSEEQIQLAATQIVSRAVYPASELKTASWIKENSAISELTGYHYGNITKDKLYESALRLYTVKDQLEQHLSHKTNELFDISDNIVLYDLTNTYFEGQYSDSTLAKYGRSKEKRNDAKLVVLALVVNIYGFIKYSAIHEGNMADSKNLSLMIDKLSRCTNTQNPVVVMDAGIATEDNLAMIRAKGYHYLCVSRTKLKDCQAISGRLTVLLETKSKRQVRLKAVVGNNNTDYYLEVTSEDKYETANSMRSQFEERFKMELQKIAQSLERKGGVKKASKVHERIGRARERYPSVQYYYDIEVTLSKDNRKVIAMSWSKNEQQYAKKEASLGLYFLRTSLLLEDEVMIWNIYNTIREIESSFRTLKTDLDLRPVYHKSDVGAMAHLHLGLLAYWVVNTIRRKLKAHGIHSHWPEIVRIGNTQKIITTHGTNMAGIVIGVRKCCEPGEQLRNIQSILLIKAKPFAKRKSVVHKPELKKTKTLYLKASPPG